MSFSNETDALYWVKRQLDVLAEQIDQTKILAAQPMVREFRNLKEAIRLARAEFRSGGR